jgi:hypothetical protein
VVPPQRLPEIDFVLARVDHGSLANRATFVVRAIEYALYSVEHRTLFDTTPVVAYDEAQSKTERSSSGFVIQ